MLWASMTSIKCGSAIPTRPKKCGNAVPTVPLGTDPWMDRPLGCLLSLGSLLTLYKLHEVVLSDVTRRRLEHDAGCG